MYICEDCKHYNQKDWDSVSATIYEELPKKCRKCLFWSNWEKRASSAGGEMRDKRVESMQIGVDVVDNLRSEVERLTRERDSLRGLDAAHNDEYRELRAEVERLRALLRECEPHINEHYDDGADLCKRIRAALGEGE